METVKDVTPPRCDRASLQESEVNCITRCFAFLQHLPQKISQGKPSENFIVKHRFYDIKAKTNITAKVTSAMFFGRDAMRRYGFKAKTKDGRTLFTFVKKEDWDRFEREQLQVILDWGVYDEL